MTDTPLIRDLDALVEAIRAVEGHADERVIALAETFFLDELRADALRLVNDIAEHETDLMQQHGLGKQQMGLR